MRTALIVCIFFVKIIFLSCIFENKHEQDLFNEINQQRKTLGLSSIKHHLTLRLAAEKRCTNQDELNATYQAMISNTYNDDRWPKQQQLDRMFSHVAERIYFNNLDTYHNNVYQQSLIPNLRQANPVYIGIAVHEGKIFSAKCILYGSLTDKLSNHERLVRLLYILISCGIFLLGLIVCSLMNDQRNIKLKQQIEQQPLDNRHTMVPKKSINTFIGKDRKSSVQRSDLNRTTLTRLKSLVDERPSAVHSFVENS